ncbi:MAG: flagellar export chaperone FlgN [Oscillospiraceae bacterium]|nr:flagellar export chaperone FlgN [Oscillospiraceae bacterium]
MADFYPELTELLLQRNRLAENYLELTVKQKALIEAEDTDGLSLNLSQRDNLIEAFNELQKKLENPLRDFREAKSKDRENQKALDAAALISETESLLLKVKDADVENTAAVKDLMRRLGDESKKLNAARKGISSYSADGIIGSAEFFDQMR